MPWVAFDQVPTNESITIMSARKSLHLPTDIQMSILELFGEAARNAVSTLRYDEAWRCYAQLLLPTILVNRDWATRGTDLLWLEPFTPALAKIHPQRRQMYADKVQSIGLYLYRQDHFDCPAAFANLSFSQLKRLEINSCPSWMQLDLRPYMNSSITSFTMLGCPHFPSSLLDLIAFCCPKLRDVHLDYTARNQGDEHLLKFLRKCRDLRELTLSSQDGTSISSDVLETLASRKQLECLYAPQSLITYRSIEAIIQGNVRLRPFRNARNLSLSIESRAVKPVLLAAEFLVELQLSLADSEHNVFGLIGSFSCLETLELSFSVPKRLTVQELQLISGLVRLKDLSICGPPPNPYQANRPLLIAEAWTDDKFESWISGYPHLEKLSLNMRSMDSHWISETRLIGRSCPKLTTLSMDGIHDIGAWRVSSQPLFPTLLELELGQLKSWPFSTRYVGPDHILRLRGLHDNSAEQTDDYAMGLARLIHQHAPMLEELNFGRDDLAVAVEQAYEQLKDASKKHKDGMDVVMSD
jgi:hypothetical protein